MTLIKTKSSDLFVFATSLIIFIVPLITDQATLPKGWELPKVYFLQLAIFILITCFCLHRLSTKKKLLQRVSLKIPGAIAAILVLSSVVNLDFVRAGREESPIYNFLRFSGAPETILGNVFRDSGLIMLLLLLGFALVLIEIAEKRHLRLLLTTLLFAILLQSFIAILQFTQLANNSPSLLTRGYVFGTFGQKNHLSGFLLSGIVIALYQLKHGGIHFRTFNALAAAVTIIAIILTQSHMALIISGVTFFLAVGFEFGLLKKRTRLILGSALLIFITLPVIIVLLDRDYRYRLFIWETVLRSYLAVSDLSQLKYLLIGSGPDTLADFLLRTNGNLHVYIDRAHNFILDIFSISGVAGILLFFFLLQKFMRKFRRRLLNRDVFYLGLLVLSWMLRGLAHESSVVNIFQIALFVPLFMIAGTQSSKK